MRFTRRDMDILSEAYSYVIAEQSGDAATRFASNAHEEWRKGWVDRNGGKSVPNVKKNTDGSEGDINVSFDKLHPDWQKENLDAGSAAADAIRQFPNAGTDPTEMEQASEYIHNEWMRRNPKEARNAAQHVPYSDLPEDEKEKDRVHVRTILQMSGK